MNVFIKIICIAGILASFYSGTSCQSAYPRLKRQLDFDWETSENFATTGTLQIYRNPRILRLGPIGFVVIDMEDQANVMILKGYNLTETITYQFPIARFQDQDTPQIWTAISSPLDSAAIILYTNNSGDALRAFKFNGDGETLFDDFVGDTDSRIYIDDFRVSRLNDYQFAVIYSDSTSTNKKLTIFNDNFTLCSTHQFGQDNILSFDMTNDDQFIYVLIVYNDAGLKTAIYKIDPNLIGSSVAETTLDQPEYNRGEHATLSITPVYDNVLFVYRSELLANSSVATVYAISKENLAPFMVSDPFEWKLVEGLKYPYPVAMEGFNAVFKKFRQSSWDAKIHIFNETFGTEWTLGWNISSAIYTKRNLTAALIQHYSDPLKSGFITVHKDIYYASQTSVVAVRIHGDICGDGVVSGNEECEGDSSCLNCKYHDASGATFEPYACPTISPPVIGPPSAVSPSVSPAESPSTVTTPQSSPQTKSPTSSVVSHGWYNAVDGLLLVLLMCALMF